MLFLNEFFSVSSHWPPKKWPLSHPIAQYIIFQPLIGIGLLAVWPLARRPAGSDLAAVAAAIAFLFFPIILDD
jgi:hypothetical protein